METRNFDYIVVGAGTAGGIVASRLSENSSASVCLIEAGPDYASDDLTPEEVLRSYGGTCKLLPIHTHDWNSVATTGPERQIHIPRGKVVGGSSAVNGQIFLRGDADDYDGWARIGLKEWSFANALPYFVLSENDLDFTGPHHGVGGPIDVRRYPRERWSEDQGAFYEAARTLGFEHCSDHNAPATTGIGPCPLNDDDQGYRASTARKYLRPARGRANLTLLRETRVERLIVSGTQVKGVLARRSDGPGSELLASETVVCGGALGTPHLLLLSGIGPANHLANIGVRPILDLPGVGAGLQDHPTVEVILPLAHPVAPWTTHPHQVVLRYSAPSSVAPNDMILYGLARPDLQAFVFRPTVNVATSRGSITITSADPKTQPCIDLNYFSEDADLKRQREAIELCFELAGTSALRTVVSDPARSPLHSLRRNGADLNRWILQNSATGYHLTSTCRMGRADDPLAVVGSDGRVHGMDGVRVVDASVMPTNVRANTNATVVMLAEYMSAMMLGRCRAAMVASGR